MSTDQRTPNILLPLQGMIASPKTTCTKVCLQMKTKTIWSALSYRWATRNKDNLRVYPDKSYQWKSVGVIFNPSVKICVNGVGLDDDGLYNLNSSRRQIYFLFLQGRFVWQIYQAKFLSGEIPLFPAQRSNWLPAWSGSLFTTSKRNACDAGTSISRWGFWIYAYSGGALACARRMFVKSIQGVGINQP